MSKKPQTVLSGLSVQTPASGYITYSNRPRVVIVLALYKGQRHLQSQLESYLHQSLPPVCVLASDDNPGDGTAAVFEAFSAQARHIAEWSLSQGPKRGSTANFLHLLKSVDISKTDYVALSDQDDVWLPEKLSSAVEMLAPRKNRPTLLGTRTVIWNSGKNNKVIAPVFQPPYTFANSLVQNFASGNTMVLNRAALRIVQEAIPGMPLPVAHDWWLYQLISGVGGDVLLDEVPRILYRQHSLNQIGSNHTFSSKLRRLQEMLRGKSKSWMDQNLAALRTNEHMLLRENVELLRRIECARHGKLQERISLMHRTGLHRKGVLNQIALCVALAAKRL